MSQARAFAAGLFLGLLGWLWREQSFKAQLAEADYVIQGIEEKVGAACAPVYGAFWADYACPAFLPVPAGLRPLVCAPAIRTYRSAAPGPVLQKVSAIQPGTAVLVLEENGPKERALSLSWRAEVR